MVLRECSAIEKTVQAAARDLMAAAMLGDGEDSSDDGRRSWGGKSKYLGQCGRPRVDMAI